MTLDYPDLDRLIPLDSATHAEVTGLGMDIPMRYAECVVVLADGTTTRLKKAGQFLGWSDHGRDRAFYFRAGDRVIRFRTSAVRLQAIDAIDAWPRHRAVSASSVADPRVGSLGKGAHRIVSPDGSLLYIALEKPSEADVPKGLGFLTRKPAYGSVSVAT